MYVLCTVIYPYVEEIIGDNHSEFTSYL